MTRGRRPGTVPAETTRLTIATLVGAGWSYCAIAAAAGVSDSTVRGIARGERRHLRVDPSTQRALAAVDPTRLPRHTYRRGSQPLVPRHGVNRRVQALLVMGWPHATLSARMGVATRTLTTQPGSWVTRSTYDAVARVYRELAHRRGPSELTARRALARGYAGPLDWDDIDTDEAPDTAACF